MRDWAAYWRETISQWNVSEADRNLLAIWYTGLRHAVVANIAVYFEDRPKEFLSDAQMKAEAIDTITLARDALSSQGIEYAIAIKDANTALAREMKADIPSNNLLIDLYAFDRDDSSRQFAMYTREQGNTSSSVPILPIYRYILRQHGRTKVETFLRKIHKGNVAFFQELYREY